MHVVRIGDAIYVRCIESKVGLEIVWWLCVVRSEEEVLRYCGIVVLRGGG